MLRPDAELSAARQPGRPRAETDRATAEGYAGLRAFIGRGRASALGTDLAVVTHRETHAAALFGGRPHTGTCADDRRRVDRAPAAAMDAANQAAFSRPPETAPARTAPAGRPTADPRRRLAAPEAPHPAVREATSP
ncbi:hypothetical protein T261_6949 [Streptomyces lydicus]|nr:hypothetical protein T261_6949 [Streptomyces lydicus]